MFIKAENIIVSNMPLMMFAVYACILGLSWLGANMIVVGDLTTGELMSLFDLLYEYYDESDDAFHDFVMVTMSFYFHRSVSQRF